MSIDTVIAANRFGLGMRADDELPRDPRAWLIDQLDRFDPRPAALSGLPSRADISLNYNDYQATAREFRELRKSAGASENATREVEEMRRKSRKNIRDNYALAVDARLNTAVQSENGFGERLVHFWSNHFAISAEKLQVIPFAGNFEFEAVRPYIMGNFGDLLQACIMHPAMLLYLDQAQSIGPGSQFAQRTNQRRKKQLGLNENLAREVLELHTLGVRSVYSQTDVTELARALTGITVRSGKDRRLERLLGTAGEPGETAFVAQLHEPGSRQLLGKPYRQDGAQQAKAILADLATHPETARHIAQKLARHFTSDTPPASLVERLEKDFIRTGGDLTSLYRALVNSPESWPQQWNVDQAKFKSPWEWTVSALRMIGPDALPGSQREQTARIFQQLGQPIWKPGSPAGYADQADSWAGGAALMRRVELAARMGERSASRIDAREMGARVLPGLLSASTTEAIARAESPAQGLSLLLVSPEFLRR